MINLYYFSPKLMFQCMEELITIIMTQNLTVHISH